MSWFTKLITNPYLVTAVGSWFIAQVLKVMIHLMVHKKLELERLIGDGGMPSGHSATVTSLAAITGLNLGFDTFQFAIAAVFAIVVCHDAMGVRQQAGKHAEMLNEIIRILEEENLPQVKLKELLGHTPLQVSAGILIGIINACILHFFYL